MRKGFLREHAYLLTPTIWLLDLVLLFAASYFAFYLYFYQYLELQADFHNYREPIILSLLLAGLVFPLTGLYQPWRGVSIVNEARTVTLALALVFLTLVVVSALTKTSIYYSRSWFTLWFLLAWFILIAYHGALRVLIKWARATGFNQRSIAVVGSGEIADRVIQQILKTPWTGFQIAGIFNESPSPATQSQSVNFPHRSYAELSDFIKRENIDQVWLAIPFSHGHALEEILHELRHCTADIRYIPDIFGFRLLNHSITEVAGLPIVNLCVTPMDGINRFIKLCEDWILSIIILLSISPLMFFIAIGVKFSSPGPVFYKQERVGWNGKNFNMLKFRSMPIDAEAKTGAVWAKAAENRATHFGSFLRKTSLDELPQFINVLKGDMSIVGPRPERPIFVEKFKEEIPDYMKKHLVKAGITGWAQINGWRGDTDLRKRIEYDLFYIENWSIWLDIKIIVLTLFKGLIHKNAY